MIAVDELLKQRQVNGNPVRVALIGAGAAARMIALHLLVKPPRGLRLVAIGNRTLQHAETAWADSGFRSVTMVTSRAALEGAVDAGAPAITDNAMLVCEANNVDAIVDCTGTIEHGAHIAMAAIEHRKHLILVNSELDATLGPILKLLADRAGITYTNADGDEPGVAMTLLRYLTSIGLKPVAAGNLKGMVDRYRNPTTQQGFAASYSMNPKIVASFADGTKLAMEAAVLANATGFKVSKRGMCGPPCSHVKEIVNFLPLNQMLDGGLVDYALGAEPFTGAFVVVHEEHPLKQKHLEYLKMGKGPLYVFYTPFHLPHIQIASTIARAVLARDATVAPIAGPVCEVAAVAKKDLRRGEVLDGVGGFTTYGVIDNAPAFSAEDLLPMGLSEGCRLTRDIAKDAPIRWADVEVPAGRLANQLYAEQKARFSQPMSSSS